MKTVQRGSWSSTAPTSKRGRKTMPVPLARTQFVATNKPWVWKIGRACNSTSSGRKPHTWCSAAVFDARLRCDSTAPLGLPVVPLV